jgi:hypothetical protein
MESLRETRERDGRSWRIGLDADVAWIMEGTSEGPGNGIDIVIPPLYTAYWTVDAPGSAGRRHDRDTALGLDKAVIGLLDAHTQPQAWWIGFLQRGCDSHLVFPDAPKVAVINGGVVLIEAEPQQALDWRDEAHGWPHGSLPDVIFPRDRSWLSITGWDDYWMSVGGSSELQQAFSDHPVLRDYARAVSYNDPDVTPPGHDVWWHRVS